MDCGTKKDVAQFLSVEKPSVFNAFLTVGEFQERINMGTKKDVKQVLVIVNWSSFYEQIYTG